MYSDNEFGGLLLRMAVAATAWRQGNHQYRMCGEDVYQKFVQDSWDNMTAVCQASVWNLQQIGLV